MGVPAQVLAAFLQDLRKMRGFTEQPVPEEALRDILEVARWTGSAANRHS